MCSWRSGTATRAGSCGPRSGRARATRAGAPPAGRPRRRGPTRASGSNGRGVRPGAARPAAGTRPPCGQGRSSLTPQDRRAPGNSSLCKASGHDHARRARHLAAAVRRDGRSRGDRGGGYSAVWVGASPSVEQARPFLEATTTMTSRPGSLTSGSTTRPRWRPRTPRRRTPSPAASCSASGSAARRRRPSTRARSA